MGTNIKRQGEMMLGELIRDLRIRRDLTQGQLAEYSRLDRTWVSQVETNAIRTPDPRKLGQLAKVLHVDIEELFIAAGYLRRSDGPRLIEDMTTEELRTQAERLWTEMERRSANGHANEKTASVWGYDRTRIPALAS